MEDNKIQVALLTIMDQRKIMRKHDRGIFCILQLGIMSAKSKYGRRT